MVAYSGSPCILLSLYFLNVKIIAELRNYKMAFYNQHYLYALAYTINEYLIMTNYAAVDLRI